MKGRSAPGTPDVFILAISADHEVYGSVESSEEFRAIGASLQRSRHRERVDLRFSLAARIDDLIQNINALQPTVVHFSTHGSESDQLYLAGENGVPHTLDREDLCRLFAACESVQAVVLNACHSCRTASAVAQHVPLCIGMQGPFSGAACTAFSATFYGSLGNGESFGIAFDQACVSLGSIWQVEAEASTPKIFSKSGVDPASLFLIGQKGSDIEDSLGWRALLSGDYSSAQRLLPEEALRTGNPLLTLAEGIAAGEGRPLRGLRYAQAKKMHRCFTRAYEQEETRIDAAWALCLLKSQYFSANHVRDPSPSLASLRASIQERPIKPQLQDLFVRLNLAA
ncbi:MAG: CHAT domain-containing protein [Acidobacteriota bacterium]